MITSLGSRVNEAQSAEEKKKIFFSPRRFAFGFSIDEKKISSGTQGK